MPLSAPCQRFRVEPPAIFVILFVKVRRYEQNTSLFGGMNVVEGDKAPGGADDSAQELAHYESAPPPSDAVNPSTATAIHVQVALTPQAAEQARHLMRLLQQMRERTSGFFRWSVVLPAVSPTPPVSEPMDVTGPLWVP